MAPGRGSLEELFSRRAAVVACDALAQVVEGAVDGSRVQADRTERQDRRPRRLHDVFAVTVHRFTELLARTSSGDLDADVVVDRVAVELDHPSGEVEHVDRLAHLEHEHLVVLADG